MKLDFGLSTYVGKIKKSSSYFYTFINRNSLSAGILLLRPGEEDTQEPHDVDEVYYVISGDGFLKIKDKDCCFRRQGLFCGKKCKALFSWKQKESQSCIFLAA
ncbi:cupin domain-containing protein [Nitrosopumilus sp.]|uniref:cupin domain-containing protein n=1 Tax=Nitrosopumilus sp. TaxID=2024843 RepID=UPI00292E3F39|nr:cupin domain-containing protein [Nitrosopumilus sp.]